MGVHSLALLHPKTFLILLTPSQHNSSILDPLKSLVVSGTLQVEEKKHLCLLVSLSRFMPGLLPMLLS